MSRVSGPLVDVRKGEARPAMRAFLLLGLIIAGHTMLETARDALFLGKLPANRLALVYALVAAVALLVAGPNARFVRRFGEGRALFVTLAGAAAGTVVLYLQPLTPAVVFGIYVWSAFLGTVMVVQLWMFFAQVFTASQGKRLFGPISAGGVTGAMLGAGAAAAALSVVPVKALLLGAAACLAAAALLSTTLAAGARDAGGEEARPREDEDPPARGIDLLRRYPYVAWLAVLIALSTATVLGTDYLFKADAARRLPASELGPYFARSYAVFNAAAFVVQVLVAGPLVRRAGVAHALVLMPALLFAGSAAALITGAPSAIVITKGVDGSLRHSLQRLTLELLGLPLSAKLRARVKPALDGAVPRAVQALMAGVIFLLATARHGSPRELSVIVAALALGWLLVALGIRRSHLAQWRRAISSGYFDAERPIDLDARLAEVVSQDLASGDPARVIGAMELCAQIGREGSIPGAVLAHESEEVQVRALDLMARERRADWAPRAERLLSPSSSEPVRIAAVRALSACGAVAAVERCLHDPSPSVRAHAAVALTRADGAADPLAALPIAELLTAAGDPGRAGRLALLDAIGDAGEGRFAEVLLAMTDPADAEIMERAVAAMASVRDPRFIPVLVRRLHVRSGRMAVRDALVHLGDRAQEALERALRDEATEPAVRLHIPRTLSRFGNQRAADFLTAQLAIDPSRLVRYKVLRGLGRLVASADVRVNGPAIWDEMRKNLDEHLGILARWVPIERHPETRERECGKLLLGLLDDKLRQSIERVFRLLQIVYRDEDIHHVYSALRSSDARGRSNALEFLDALTSDLQRDQDRETRDLLKIAVDDLSAPEKLRRAGALLRGAPWEDDAPASEDVGQFREAALLLLLRDRDPSLAALAAYHALELGRSGLQGEIDGAVKDRPSLLELVGGVWRAPGSEASGAS